MERISNKVLVSCLIGEMMALVCSIVLTEKSNYIWFIVAIFATIIVFTFHECICRLNNIITLWNENSQVKEQLWRKKSRYFVP